MFARIDEDNANEAVRSFNDLHPYPPPAEDFDEYRQKWQDEDRRIADFHLHWPRRPYREDLRVLVVGGCAAQAAMQALRRPSAHVIGIDISETNIHHVLELKQKYNLSNLEMYRLPIEQVQELGEDFDLIVCTGILHHLSDPQAGLCALRAVLDTNGALDVTVHAPYGRAGVYMLQEYCHRLGIGHSKAEIRDLARTLAVLPRSHPVARLLASVPHFRSPSGLADALLHPRDRAYSVPQLFDLLSTCGLKFGRWVRQARYLPQCSGLHSTPHAPRLAKLPAEEQYAALELFRGDMLRHNLIAYHTDQAEAQVLDFNKGDWLSTVPLRLPDILVLKNQLPGKAAVLINPAHEDPELSLPLDELELQIFNTIDSRRTVAEIIQLAAAQLGQTPNAIQGKARLLFEQLWWYDMVGGFISLCKCGATEGANL